MRSVSVLSWNIFPYIHSYSNYDLIFSTNICSAVPTRWKLNRNLVNVQNFTEKERFLHNKNFPNAFFLGKNLPLFGIQTAVWSSAASVAPSDFYCGRVKHIPLSFHWPGRSAGYDSYIMLCFPASFIIQNEKKSSYIIIWEGRSSYEIWKAQHSTSPLAVNWFCFWKAIIFFRAH